MRTSEHYVIVVEKQGNIACYDRNSKNLFSDENVPPSLLDIIDDDDRSLVEMAIAAVMDSGRGERITARLTMGGSSEEPATLWLNPLEGREELCSVVISRPAPESDPSFMDLQSFVMTVDKVMERIQSAVISGDQHGRILMLNQAAEEISGYSTREVLGEKMVDLFALEGEARDELIKILDEAKSGKVRNINAPLRTKNGGTFDHSWRISYAVIGEADEGIMMAFGFDPQKAPKGSVAPSEVDQNLLLLVSRSADLAAALDPSGKVDQELDDLVKAQALYFGILKVEGLERGPLFFSSGVREEVAKAILSSPSIDLVKLTMEGAPAVVELDPWAYRGKMPQDVSSVLYIPLGPTPASNGFALFGTSGSARRWTSRTPILQIFCNQTLASLKLADLIKALATRTMEIQGLYDVSQVLSSTLNLDTLLKEMADKGLTLANADRCDIYQIEEGSHSLLMVESHMTTAPHCDEKAIDEITLDALEMGKVVIRNSPPPGDGFADSPCSIISVPLVSGGGTFGVMTFIRQGVPFGERDLKLMELFATASTMAINNATLYDRLNQNAMELQAYNDLLAHDVANFNVPIHGYLEMMLTNPTLDEKQRSYVWKALRQSENITSLVSNVRRLAEIRMREGMISLRPLDLIPILTKTIEDISDRTKCRETTVFFEQGADMALAEADDEVKDIFVNLIENACEFGEGKPVEVRISPHQEEGVDYWRIDFIDQGKGVPDEWKERIFQRFWESDSDRRAEAKGLGLSVVQALCILYGGRVWVSDRREGDHTQGSVFSVILPRAH